MHAIGLTTIIPGLLVGAFAAFMSKRNPNRIANGFVLEIAVLLCLNGLFFLLWDPVDYMSPINAVIGVVYTAFLAIYLILGVALLANGVYTVRREGVSLAHALPFAWGVALVFIAYWFLIGPGYGMQMVDELTGNVLSILTKFMQYIPFALLGAWFSNDICYKTRKKPEREYIVALGCGIRKDGTVTPLLQSRLDAAIKAYEEGGRQAKIIVSGGQGADEVVPEARAMADYLLSQGIPETDVLLEAKSTTTEENLRFSRAIIDERGGAEHLTIATSDYHCLRAAMYARRLGINASCVGGHTAAFFYPAAFFREYIALIMRNRYAVVLFFVLTVVRFWLTSVGILPEGLI